MSNAPKANAFPFTVNAGNGSSYDVAIFAEAIFAGQEYGFRTVYRKVGEVGDWVFLTMPSIYKEDGDTPEKLVAKLRKVFEGMNSKIKEFFKLATDVPAPMPEDLFEKLEYILSNHLTWDTEKQELVYTP